MSIRECGVQFVMTLTALATWLIISVIYRQQSNLVSYEMRDSYGLLIIKLLTLLLDCYRSIWSLNGMWSSAAGLSPLNTPLVRALGGEFLGRR
ncbi:hypothetical protein J6590_041011 [Homalodisca vitripennis]|nr:hypothetical protein J6590_041011 [Homalodisca vitripennis]